MITREFENTSGRDMLMTFQGDADGRGLVKLFNVSDSQFVCQMARDEHGRCAVATTDPIAVSWDSLLKMHVFLEESLADRAQRLGER